MKHIKVKLLSVVFISMFFSANIFASQDETYEKLKLMIDVMQLIDTNYVNETKSKDLAVGAIKGVVGSLDPFSQYMEEKAYKEMKNETEGSYGGVGLRIMVKNNYITIVSPMVGTPAFKVGILPEDRIIKIDGKDAVGMSSDEAVDLMRGKPNTKVKLTISRDKVQEPLEFTITREKIKIETVKSIMLDDKIGYIRLTEFNAQGADDIEKAIEDFYKDGMKGLVLDLRNNPGGLLDTSIKVISMFIKEKTIALTTRGRVEGALQEYYTKGDGKYSDLPLVVLVNRGSASASEIVSGALQDFNRALIIGNNTFGKGSVQTVFPLSDGTALRLTIAKYYLPSGRPINHSNDKNAKNGITPDIEIEVSIEDEIKLYTQGDMIFAKDKTPQSAVKEEKVEDKVLAKAIEVINENKVSDLIKNKPKNTEEKK